MFTSFNGTFSYISLILPAEISGNMSSMMMSVRVLIDWVPYLLLASVREGGDREASNETKEGSGLGELSHLPLSGQRRAGNVYA